MKKRMAGRHLFSAVLVVIACAGFIHPFKPVDFNQVIKKCGYQIGDTLSNCLEARKQVTCNPHSQFRTLDGTCNNLKDTTRGAAQTPLRRLIYADYIDNGETPRGSSCYTGQMNHFVLFTYQGDRYGSLTSFDRWTPNYPTSHHVARSLFHITNNGPSSNTRELSTLYMTFGQFLDHDIALAPHEECKTNSCLDNSNDFKYPCMPLKFVNTGSNCTGFGRSKPVCPSDNSIYRQRREQINMVTSYIDGSMIYGNDEKAARLLRTMDGYGTMKLTKDGLMEVDNSLNTPEKCKANDGCSFVGDERGDENIALHSMHTLWVREHNRIADKLKEINPHWTGENIYNNARKIIGGILQHIVYNEYLSPLVDLSKEEYSGYKETSFGSIINTFSTAAFRYGHSLIPNSFSQVDLNFNKIRPDVDLQNAFFNTEFVHKNGIESTMMGLCANQSNNVNTEFSHGIGRKLFIPIGKEGYEDLTARNIQRGRDHGIHTYGQWRQICGLPTLKSFFDLYFIMQDGAAEAFQKLYHSPNDIDLFAAGIAERHLPGLIVGETFHCIIKRQFKDLRDGDRFFYLNKGVFTKEQQDSLKKASLAKVLCNNLKNIVSIQKNVFRSFYAGETRVSCEQIDDIDLNLWKEYEFSIEPESLVTRCELGNSYSNCKQARQSAICNFFTVDTFRTIDGTCNNKLVNVWGSSNMPLTRLQPSRYQDGSGIPMGYPCSTNGFIDPNHQLIPTPHEISKQLFQVTTTEVKNKNQLSTLFMTFGQFLDHDISLTPHEECKAEDCSNIQDMYTYPCFPIKISKNQESCTGFGRSLPVCKRHSYFKESRDQVNTVTAFIDAGQIYGNDPVQQRRLRTSDGTGKLKLTGEGLLQEDPLFPVEKCQNQVGCSLVGDERCDENIALQAMHTLWAREHNRIASKLAIVNQHWNGDEIYNNARKIIGGVFQHITYNEFLPHITDLPKYDRYIPYLNPSIINSFSTAAYRFGHSLVPNAFSQLDNNFNQLEKPIILQKAFFNLNHNKQFGIEPTLMGLVGNQSGDVNLEFSDGVARKLFVPFGQQVLEDLMARNIQRGRDHGLPSYGTMRRMCNLTPVNSFSELRYYMQNEAVDVFQKLYDHPNDIDLFAAGMAENHQDNLIVGPTFNCIIRQQFYALREGDRFFYLRRGSSNYQPTFTSVQRETISGMTMAKILCNNLKGLVSIQRNVFKSYFGGEKRVECSTLPDLNIAAWKEFF